MLRRGRTFVAGFIINLLVISSFVLSSPSPLAACPDEPPKTLLQLYRDSDAIYIARFAGIEKGNMLRKEENFEIFRKTRHFDIESEVKGIAKERFTLEEEDWVYLGDPATDSEEDLDHEAGLEEADVIDGDRVLLFLRRDEEDGQKLVLTDYRDGIKKLSDEAFPVYLKRLKELNSIFAKEDPSDERIVDWLVDVAEDPITRWEGAFELLQAFETLEWREQEAKAEKDKVHEDAVDGVEIVADGDSDEILEGERDISDNSGYAKALTDGHKQRLSNILVNATNKGENGEEGEVKGDMELINLVYRWGDSQVAEVLLTRLASEFGTPWDRSSIMSSIAKLLDDAKLKKVSEEYIEIAWGDEDAEVEEIEAVITAPVEAVLSGNPATKRPLETHPDPVPPAKDQKDEPVVVVLLPDGDTDLREPDAAAYREPASKKKATDKPVKFGQKRAELMSSFLSRAHSLLEQKRASNQKNSH